MHFFDSVWLKYRYNVQKRIDMIPIVANEEDDSKLIGVVSRQDVLKEKLNEIFISIGKE
jgi:predicted transcriptional regulator